MPIVFDQPASTPQGGSSQDLINNVFKQYPGIAAHYKDTPVQVIMADEARQQANKTYGGGGGLEFWPMQETGAPEFPHPTGGKSVALEIYDQNLKNNPEELQRAVYGDLLHGMRDDPVYAKAMEEFVKHYTPNSQRNIEAQTKERLAAGEDPENVRASINDGWMRGYLAPGKGPQGNDEFNDNQKKFGNVWSPEQIAIMDRVKAYLQTGQESPSSPSNSLGGRIVFQDEQNALNQAPGPIPGDLNGARDRAAEAQQLQDLLGGQIIDPQTGQPAYSSQAVDAKTIRLAELADQQKALQKEMSDLQAVASATPLESTAAGAQMAPVGLLSLGAMLANAGVGGLKQSPLFNANAPVQLPQGQVAPDLGKILTPMQNVAAVNPFAGATGLILGNAAMSGGPGGAIQALAKGSLPSAAVLAAPGAVINTATGQAIRSATGQETGLGDVLTDAITGAATGGRPIGVGDDIANIAGKIRVPQGIADTPIARGVVRYAGAAKDVAVNATKGAGKLFTPKPLVDDFMEASTVRSRFNPKRGIKDLENAKKGWENIEKRPDLLQEVYDQGHTLESAEEAKDFFGQLAKNVYAERKAMVGQDVPIDLDSSVAKAIEEVANDPVVKRQHPQLVETLLEEADKYRDTIGSVEAEELNKAFNAQVEVLRARLSASEFEALKKSNPMLRASAAASEAMKKELVKGLGGEHSELGRLYGAAKTAQELAALQEVKQLAQELKPGGLERLNSTASIGTSLVSPIAGATQFVAGKIIKEAYSPNRNYKILDNQVRKMLEKAPTSTRSPLPQPVSPLSDMPRGATPRTNRNPRLEKLKGTDLYKNATPEIKRQLEEALSE